MVWTNGGQTRLDPPQQGIYTKSKNGDPVEAPGENGSPRGGFLSLLHTSGVS